MTSCLLEPQSLSSSSTTFTVHIFLSEAEPPETENDPLAQVHHFQSQSRKYQTNPEQKELQEMFVTEHIVLQSS